MARKRLDVLMVECGLCGSREQAKAYILAGEVWSNNQRLDKPGHEFDVGIALEIRGRSPRFVSRGGEKLKYAIDRFGVNPKDRICLDVGASTGGFTDCLLQAGASHVFAVDVGYGQLEEKLRKDPRVSVVEKTNARYLTLEILRVKNTAADRIELVTIDVSFISLPKIIEPLKRAFPGIQDWVLLFKPQFEVGQKYIGKGGIVRSSEATASALEVFQAFMKKTGFILRGGPEISPLAGKKSGNLEYLVHYVSS